MHESTVTTANAVTLSDAAAQRISSFLEKRGKGIGLRLGVKTTGCSGMAYTLEYADSLDAHDHVFEQKGVKIIVSPKDLAYLQGCQLDFTREGLNEGFKFLNPNEKARCGCGESFTV